MITRVATSLNLRRKNLVDNDKGFTLIELLVVVIIIGILAAIAIPVYLGVQNNAKDAGVKSDLSNAKTAVIAYQTDNNAFPTNAQLNETDLKSYGFSHGANTGTIKYSGTAPTGTATAFCLVVPKASNASENFYVTDTKGVNDTGC